MLNWRLSKLTSPGLVGEMGIHSIDLMNWYLNALPSAVTGFGSIIHWNDGRDVPDTMQCMIEYPNGVRFGYDATLVNSFDDAYDVMHGSDSAFFMRGEKAWMINEADAQLAGWIVYARKEPVNDSVGVVLVADASKLLALGKIPGKDGAAAPAKTMLHYALKEFATAVQTGKQPSAGPEEGYKATVVALLANQAVNTNSRVEIRQEMLSLA